MDAIVLPEFIWSNGALPRVFCSAELARAVRTALGGVDISFQPDQGGELMSVQFENLLLGELRTAYSAKAGKMITIPLHEPHERFGIK